MLFIQYRSFAPGKGSSWVAGSNARVWRVCYPNPALSYADCLCAQPRSHLWLDAFCPLLAATWRASSTAVQLWRWLSIWNLYFLARPSICGGIIRQPWHRHGGCPHTYARLRLLHVPENAHKRANCSASLSRTASEYGPNMTTVSVTASAKTAIAMADSSRSLTGSPHSAGSQDSTINQLHAMSVLVRHGVFEPFAAKIRARQTCLYGVVA